MQARFYLPMWGRFASPDPARDQHFELTQSWNIYSYVRNMPTMATDPTGMMIFMKSEDDAKRAVADFQKGLSKSEGGLVSYEKSGDQYRISVGKNESKDSEALGAIRSVATSEKQNATIRFLKPGDTVNMKQAQLGKHQVSQLIPAFKALTDAPFKKDAAGELHALKPSERGNTTNIDINMFSYSSKKTPDPKTEVITLFHELIGHVNTFYTGQRYDHRTMGDSFDKWLGGVEKETEKNYENNK